MIIRFHVQAFTRQRKEKQHIFLPSVDCGLCTEQCTGLSFLWCLTLQQTSILILDS